MNHVLFEPAWPDSLRPFAPSSRAPIPAAGQEAPRPRVLLVHGLGRTARSMRALARFMSAQGFEVWSLNYPSRSADAQTLADQHLAPALRFLSADNRPTHIVSHSLGGILARLAFAKTAPLAGTRLVMLAPPNAGSEIVDRLGNWRVFRWLLGPAALQLGSNPQSIPQSLPPVPDSVPCAVIAGTRSGDPWFNSFFDGLHDGKVSLASARLPPPCVCVEVRATHTFLMNHPAARRSIADFLAAA